MTTQNTTTDNRHDLRVSQLADEISERRARRVGHEVEFGLETGIAAQKYLQAASLIDNAQGFQPDLLAMTFLMPTQDAELLYRTGGYALKGLIAHLICAKVRTLLECDGQQDAYNGLCLQALHGSTQQSKDEARADLLELAAPYFELAQDILADEVRVYNPATPTGPKAFKGGGRG